MAIPEEKPGGGHRENQRNANRDGGPQGDVDWANLNGVVAHAVILAADCAYCPTTICPGSGVI
jgi:hypothetical protein